MMYKECTKCIHKAVCKTAESCDGFVSGCKHFKGWISVKDRLPKTFGIFLVVVKAKEGRLYSDSASYDPYLNMWQTNLILYDGDNVTHWMPLPQPPKGE